MTGLHKSTTLISIGVVDENGRSFYAELMDYDENQLDSWLIDNVITKLLFNTTDESFISINQGVTYCKGTIKEIAEYLDGWLSYYNQDTIEIWSDCLAYDWVLFVDLYGDAFDIPDNILYIPFDICTLMKAYDVDPDINREEFIKSEGLNFNNENKHNALHDAMIIKACHDKLIKLYSNGKKQNL
jgi:hypothetical protein